MMKKYFLVENPTLEDLNASIQGGNAIKSSQTTPVNKYYILSPIDSDDTFSNGIELEPDEVKVFAAGKLCNDYSTLTPESEELITVMQSQVDWGVKVLEMYRIVNSGLTVTDQGLLMDMLSRAIMALNNGLLLLARDIIYNTPLQHPLFSQEGKDFLIGKIDEYYEKFPLS